MCLHKRLENHKHPSLVHVILIYYFNIEKNEGEMWDVYVCVYVCLLVRVCVCVNMMVFVWMFTLQFYTTQHGRVMSWFELA